MKAVKSVLISLLLVTLCPAMALAMPYGRVIIVNTNGTGDYPTIQTAINDSNDGDTIVLQPGTYTGDGNRDIDFLGKAIIVRCTDPNDPNIVANTVIDCNGTQAEPHRGFYFHSGEDANSVLTGLTITNGYANSGGGGIRCEQSSPTITKCIISGNSSSWDGGGIFNWVSNPTVNNCRFISNHAAALGGGIKDDGSSSTIVNCLFWGNSTGTGGHGGGISTGYSTTIKNCTFSGNKAKYGGAMSCGTGGSGSYFTYIVNCILWGDIAPNGSEIAAGSDWLDRWVYLSIYFSVVQGDITAFYLYGSCDGDIGLIYNTDPCFADPNNGDFHLKSQAGRWDANEGRWTKDEVTSLCIDAGNPSSPIGYEPFPNGGIINMGAYGGTAEASKSYFGEPVCETIVAGDINGDCKVDFKDFALMALHWQEDNN